MVIPTDFSQLLDLLGALIVASLTLLVAWMLATTRKDLVQVQLNRLEKELFRHYSLP